MIFKMSLPAFNDGKDAHHILPQQTLKKLGLNTDEAPAVILPKNLHEKTASHGVNKQKYGPFKSLKEEVEYNIQEVVQIMKENGAYSQHVENSMRQAMDAYMAKYPKIFK